MQLQTFITAHNKLAARVYVSLPDAKSRTSFALVCKNFYGVAQKGNAALKVYQYVMENYSLILESSSFSKITPQTILDWNVLLLSEYHCSSYHRKLNSELCSLAWGPNRRVFTEADDDSQIPEASEEAKEARGCWDLQNEWAAILWLLMDSGCELCRSYLKCLNNDEFDFLQFANDFLDNSLNLIQNTSLAPFNYDELVDLCKKGMHAEPSEKNRILLRLLLKLNQEMKKRNAYRAALLESNNLKRDLSLFNNVNKAVLDKMEPIVVGGFFHISSKILASKLFRTSGIKCLALKPHNRPDSVELSSEAAASGQSARGNFIRELAEVAAPEWTECAALSALLVEKKDDAEAFCSILFSHADVVERLKEKIKGYRFDPGTNMFFWAELPTIIYYYDLFKLSKLLA